MKGSGLPVLLLLCALSAGAAAADLSGNWEIASSVGGNTPITVHCSIQQSGSELTGSCIPEMDNAEPSALNGTVEADSAEWGYDVIFNGSPGTVTFSADEISDTVMSGILDLSGTKAPFTARKETELNE